MKRHITGQEIVELFEWTEHKLIEAVKGGLEPFDPIDDSRITKEVNPCLYCDGGKIVDHSIVLDNHICSNSGGLMSAPGGLMGEYESYTRMRLCTAVNIPAGALKGPWLCKDDWQRQELAKRLLKASFVTAEVQAHALAHNLPALGQTIPAANESPHGEQVGAVPHFANASDLVFFHRGRGVHELHELARLVDEEFTGTAKLTDEALGRLLPANPGTEVSDEARKRQGYRLRKAYQQKAG